MPIVFAKPVLPPPAGVSWDISNISAAEASYGSSQAGANGVSFKPDGTKMYIASSAGNLIGEYNLSTAWLVSSASQVQTTAGGTDPREVVLSADGSRAFIASNGDDLIYQRNLSNPWTFDSAVLAGSFDPSDSSPTGVFLRSDGLKMYVMGNGSGLVKGYTLGTAWDITTAGTLDSSFSVASQESARTNVLLDPAGTRMFVSGYTGSVYQYDLSVAWDVGSAQYNSVSAALGLGRPSVTFKPDGSKMYVVNDTNSTVYQYSL